MSHPLLTKVIAGPIESSYLAEVVVAQMDPAIADRLEAALGGCAFHGCYQPEHDPFHQQPDPKVGARLTRHMFVPLVRP